MRRKVYILALTFLLAAAGGCFFEPRVAELPAGQQIVYLNQSLPENVWENIQTSLRFTDASGYDSQIAEEFIYEPDSATESMAPGYDWTNWNRLRELAFINDLYNNVNSIEANLRFEIIDTDWAGSRAELRYTYKVDVTGSDGSVVTYMAEVVVEFIIEGAEWVLTRWYDVQQESETEGGSLNPTLGSLRAAFALSGGG